MLFRFRRPTLDDAQMILDWRTDPAVTRYMFTDIEPDLERQRAWLTGCAARPDFRHFVIEHDAQAPEPGSRGSRPIGYLCYYDIDTTQRRCSSGSYIGRAEDRRRLAGFLHSFILDYAFYRLDAHKLVNCFMAGNDAVIQIQHRLKFREVGVLREHVRKYGRWHDVHVFEMLRREWEVCPHPFPRAQTLAAFEE